MTDAFISYSRRDKEFVQRLHERLAGQQRQIWVDWEDIPPTADWRAEIRSGIEATQAVIFVISPDFVRSKECRVELELALENNKRIVPVMRRMITAENDKPLVHEALNSHNWVYLRDEDDFEKGYQTLANALDTDLDYVRVHTRLFTRAREWETKDRDHSLLLRGSDLSTAESWLGSSINKKPPPMPLHTDYIAVSRGAEIARSRRLLAGVSVALVVAVALTILSFVLYRQSDANLSLANIRGTDVAHGAATSDANAVRADNNASTADANAIIAQENESRAKAIALAAQAQNDINNSDPERGALLALEALRNYPYTSQAEAALAQAVQMVTPSQLYPGTTQNHSTIVAMWSPDNQHIAIMSEEGEMVIWNISDQSETARLNSGVNIYDAAWSPDGRYIATADENAVVTVWDAVGNERYQVNIAYNPVWSPDGTMILAETAYPDNSAWMIVDAETGQQVVELSGGPPSDNYYQPAVWSPDGELIATGDATGIVTIWNTEGEKLVEWRASQDVISVINWSPDGGRIITGSGANDANFKQGVADVWDATTGELIMTLWDYGQAVLTASWSPDGSRILTSAGEAIDIWDGETGDSYIYVFGYNPQWSPDGSQFTAGSLQTNKATVFNTYSGDEAYILTGHSKSVFAASWSPEADHIATVSPDGTVRVWDVASPEELLNIGGYFPVWSPDGSALWVANAEGIDTRWDLEQKTQETHPEFSILAIAPAGDLRYAGTNSEGKLAVRNPAAGDEVVFEGHQAGISMISWSPDGNEIASADLNNGVSIWNATTGEERLTLSGTVVNWSPDGTQLIVVSKSRFGGDDTVTIYDATSGESLRTLPVELPENPLYAQLGIAIWSPDGRWIATTSGQDFGRSILLQIWDAETGTLRHNLQGDNVSWSPNGSRIAAIETDGIVNIWSAESGQRVHTLSDPDASITTVAWSPDGRHIATTNRYSQTKVWRIWQTTDDLIAYAEECCILRPLTTEETEQFGLARAAP
jgi:WD40 repeat protein